MDNTWKKWTQGRFVDQPQYERWTDGEKQKADRDERLRVRPSATGNAIATCPTPDVAEWIANRLNKAAQLEQSIRDYADGNIDKSELVSFVNRHNRSAEEVVIDGMRSWSDTARKALGEKP